MARLSKRARFNGRLVSLDTVKKRLPNGYVVELDIIEHPGASLIVPFLSKDRIIILRQFRPVINRYIYEFPAGTFNKGEDAVTCAKRELLEEAGYSARTLKRIGKIYPVPGYSTESIAIFRACRLKLRALHPEKDESIKVMVLSRKQLLRLFKQGRIIDAKTICALSLCGLLR